MVPVHSHWPAGSSARKFWISLNDLMEPFINARSACKQLVLHRYRSVWWRFPGAWQATCSTNTDMSGWIPATSQSSSVLAKGHQMLDACRPIQTASVAFSGQNSRSCSRHAAHLAWRTKGSRRNCWIIKGYSQSFVFCFLIRRLRCWSFVGDNIIKHERLPGL